MFGTSTGLGWERIWWIHLFYTIPSNFLKYTFTPLPLVWWRVFNLDYLHSKLAIDNFSGFGTTPSNILKYTSSRLIIAQALYERGHSHLQTNEYNMSPRWPCAVMWKGTEGAPTCCLTRYRRSRRTAHDTLHTITALLSHHKSSFIPLSFSFSFFLLNPSSIRNIHIFETVNIFKI
jgi:hypothetical protein